ncbi:hypothetical protein QE197_08200 [Arsenophonus nasoniae]|nr:hypothetical protein [Arsenophonus nasoniae]WGM12246.1 hypothetical protein QE197_08200 [Arsenophonus nasoniae]WGM16924.1 hypothetical protein QE193_08085 [Arsenophonus nasoniae]
MKHSTSHESVFQLSNIIIYYQQLLATNPIKYSIYGRDKIDDVELIKYKMASERSTLRVSGAAVLLRGC